MTGQYAAYVISAYAIAGLALSGIVAWVIADRRGARKALERAERAAERQGRAGGR